MTLEEIVEKYYGNKNGWPGLRSEVSQAEMIVFRILNDLDGRQGIGDMLGNIDSKIKEEMFQVLFDILPVL